MKFIPASGLLNRQESFYHESKSNQSQIDIYRNIIFILQQSHSLEFDFSKMSIIILILYTTQLKLLQSLEKLMNSKTINSIKVATIDSRQNREADIIMFCIIHCNVNDSIGFLTDERRMNVALTRARRELIIVGHKETLVGSEEGGYFWKAWFQSLV